MTFSFNVNSQLSSTTRCCLIRSNCTHVRPSMQQHTCCPFWGTQSFLFYYDSLCGARQNFRRRHRWIGYHNTVSSCGCNMNNCLACRAQWTWTDGSSTDYTNWNILNPQNGEIYALLDDLTMWHGFPSHETLKFICKSREIYVYYFLTLECALRKC